MPKYTEAEKADTRANNSCIEIARRFDSNLRKVGGKHAGSCPICGGGKRTACFEVTREKFVCAKCSSGGDVMRLVMLVLGYSFPQAMEFLGARRDLSDAERAHIERDRARREAKAAREQERYRERSRTRGYEIWQGGGALASNGPIADYLWARNIDPSGKRLREHLDLPFFDGESGGILHRGPAMLAAMIRPDGHFGAVHGTWVDPARPGQKARIVDVGGTELSPKKMRGSKKGAHIDLAGARDPQRLFLGEGIETVASVCDALAATGRLRPRDGFWCAGDLGNIGGMAADTVAHPTLRTAAGARPLRVPNDCPAMDTPAIVIPDSVDEIVLLGDGDSDPFTTIMSLRRAAHRYAREGRTIRIAMARPGQDFNDWARSASHAAVSAA